jgi:hypothetical protein
MAPSVRPQRARKQPGARGPEHSDYVSGSGVPSTGTTDELMLLRLAQDALQVSPARAQKLAEQHRREFPHSSVAQERDMIEISALVRLGQTAAARARAAQFRRLYPHSPYERQLQTMLPGP